MMHKAAAVAASLAIVANGAQPEAPAPVAAPMRELEWGQINFLHTTDIHGWLGGHLDEAQYSADWGDYVSFTEHMRKKADEKGVDLLIVDTGDRVEGNGLYDGSDPKGNYTYDIFGQQDVDMLCTGNHELYQEDTVAREHSITVPHFKKSYIASNLDYIEPETGNQIPQAQRYIKFKTKNQGYTVVALGFIFDFDRNANNSVVVPVAEAMKQSWFQGAIREKPDMFVVIGHVGLRMAEFEQIFKVIRDENWYTPIAFLGGHAHMRDARRFDDKAVAIASGRYFETIGWLSVDGIKKRSKTTSADASANAGVTFKRRYIDNNVLGLQHHAGVDEKNFTTAHGRNVSRMITEARKALNLDHKIGCAPRDLWMTRAKYPSDTSIYSWLENEVIPDAIVNKDRPDKARLTIVNTGAIRFDIFKGAFTTDSTYLISPFTSKFNYIPDVPYDVAKKVLQLLNTGGAVFEAELDTKYLSIPEQMAPSPFLGKQPDSLLSHAPSHPKFYDGGDQAQQRPLVVEEEEEEEEDVGDDNDEPELVNGYTTKDDLGDDGDDAVHSPIKFYSVPNCIQAQAAFPSPPPPPLSPAGDEGEGEPQTPVDPETVDLVFIDYVQPWIIPALKFSGGDYDVDDIAVYTNATLTDVIAGWVGKHWTEGC